MKRSDTNRIRIVHTWIHSSVELNMNSDLRVAHGSLREHLMVLFIETDSLRQMKHRLEFKGSVAPDHATLCRTNNW